MRETVLEAVNCSTKKGPPTMTTTVRSELCKKRRRKSNVGKWHHGLEERRITLGHVAPRIE